MSEDIIINPDEKVKEIIDIAKKEEIKEKLYMYFTVTTAQKDRMKHHLVKAESAMSALIKAQEELKAPVLGVHITEYNGYIEAL